MLNQMFGMVVSMLWITKVLKLLKELVLNVY